MSWEKRGGGSFYYRARRVDGRVRKTYIGRGIEAQLAAKADEATRARKRHDRGVLRGMEEAVGGLKHLMKELDTGVRTLMQGALLAAGYHQHRGHWRKRRDG